MKKLIIAMLACCVAFASCSKTDEYTNYELIEGDTASSLQGYWSTSDGYITLEFIDDVCYISGEVYGDNLCECAYLFDSPAITFYMGSYSYIADGSYSSSAITFTFAGEDYDYDGTTYTCYYVGSSAPADDEEVVEEEEEEEEEEVVEEEEEEEEEADEEEESDEEADEEEDKTVTE